MQSVKTTDAEEQDSVISNVGLPRPAPQPPNQKTQVVIVGAGLAGLAAAQRLYELGLRDVIVLDAQSRIGGRVHTINHSDYLLELGAQWLHGADENPLYKWLVDINMLDDFEDASTGFSGLFCTNKGEQVDQALVKRVLDIVIDSKLSLSKNRYIDIVGNNGFKNAGQVFKHQLELKIRTDDQLMRNKSLVYALFDWFLRYETIENCCDSMEEVSISSYTDWTDWGDGTLLNFKHGYRSLLDWFCQQMPSQSCIHLNKQVLNIEMLSNGGPPNNCWLDEEGTQFSGPMLVRYVDTLNSDQSSITTTTTTTTTTNKDKVQQFIECQHVIVTASLGFLKNNHETFFRPQLPEVKRELIKSIGFGTVNKIVLQFDRPFWNDDRGIKLIWEDCENKEEFPTWAQDIISFDVVRKQPNLLLGWIGGHGAKSMELESDLKVAEICIRILEKFLPSTYNKPSKLIACFCSRWNSNPFICGSYSFQSMRSFEQNVDKLHEPLYSNSTNGLFVDNNNKLVSSSCSRIPRVLFAGEATAGKLYSTTHGAIITGWREADRLVDHLTGGQKANIQQVSNGNHIILQQQ